MPRTAKNKKRIVKKPVKISRKRCVCTEQKIDYIDYKDFEIIKKFTSSINGKILPRKVTGLSPKWQRNLSKAIKRARIVGQLPFVK